MKKDKVEEIICTIDNAKDWLDNDFTFYKDGKIKNLYDQHPTKSNIVKWLKADQISDSEKTKIISKCPEEHLDEIKKILGVK